MNRLIATLLSVGFFAVAPEAFSASTAASEAKALTNPAGEVLQVDHQIAFYVDAALPAPLIESLLEAVVETNARVKREAVVLIPSPEIGLIDVEQNFVNTVTYGPRERFETPTESIKAQAYWMDDRIHEVDVELNPEGFDFAGAHALVAKTAFGRLLNHLVQN